jgi:Gram-negative bacterial TonB protein C-terminal
MRLRWVCGQFVAFVCLTFCPALSQVTKPQAVLSGGDFSTNTSAPKVPEGVILVKGASASASDSATPVPESGQIASNVFRDPYFGMSYALPPDWIQKYEGPPPSDTGRYVLAQIVPGEAYKRPDRGLILITAQDMFFNPLPAKSALELVNYSRNHLQADHKVELPPTQTTIGGRPFTFYAYWSPIAELHWYVLATEIRCHTVQITMSSRDTRLLENLILDLNKMKLPEEADPVAGMGGGSFPVCAKDYAKDENLLSRVDPVFTQHHYNAVPVRIIIDKEGKIKHIHLISAFPDQAKAVTDALTQWRFKPFLQNGKPVEVETGLMFGRSTYPTAQRERAATE